MCCLCVCLSEEEEIHRKFAHGLALFDFKKKTVVYNILYVLISVKTYAGVNDLFRMRDPLRGFILTLPAVHGLATVTRGMLTEWRYARA